MLTGRNSWGQISAAALVGKGVAWGDVACGVCVPFPVPQPESNKTAMIGSRKMLHDKLFMLPSYSFISNYNKRCQHFLGTTQEHHWQTAIRSYASNKR